MRGVLVVNATPTPSYSITYASPYSGLLPILRTGVYRTQNEAYHDIAVQLVGLLEELADIHASEYVGTSFHEYTN